MLRVVVVFEFEGITDPDSAMSDIITNVITKCVVTTVQRHVGSMMFMLKKKIASK